MKVKELIKILSKCDPEKLVFINDEITDLQYLEIVVNETPLDVALEICELNEVK